MKAYRDGGYSSVAERQTVALDVVGSTPTTHPNSPAFQYYFGTAVFRFRKKAVISA